MLRLASTPTAKVIKDIPPITIVVARNAGWNVILKTNVAKTQVEQNASVTPVHELITPRNKYSITVIVRTFLFEAPRVFSNTLSCVRWKWLLVTTPTRTIIPVNMLKRAIN